jgi:hypothetical protein
MRSLSHATSSRWASCRAWTRALGAAAGAAASTRNSRVSPGRNAPWNSSSSGAPSPSESSTCDTVSTPVPASTTRTRSARTPGSAPRSCAQETDSVSSGRSAARGFSARTTTEAGRCAASGEASAAPARSAAATEERRRERFMASVVVVRGGRTGGPHPARLRLATLSQFWERGGTAGSRVVLPSPACGGGAGGGGLPLREGCRPEGARPRGSLRGLDSVSERSLLAYGAAARPRRQPGARPNPS